MHDKIWSIDFIFELNRLSSYYFRIFFEIWKKLGKKFSTG